jgi:hypothetical protein
MKLMVFFDPLFEFVKSDQLTANNPPFDGQGLDNCPEEFPRVSQGICTQGF